MSGSKLRMGLILIALGLSYAQQPQPQTGLLPPTVRFQGNISLAPVSGKAKAAKPLSVTIHRWSVLGGRTVERFPETGFVLVQLLAGRVTTNIGGKQQNRSMGDVWVVPAGASMALRVQREMATLETIAVQ
jgi:hypothetical protein